MTLYSSKTCRVKRATLYIHFHNICSTIQVLVITMCWKYFETNSPFRLTHVQLNLVLQPMTPLPNPTVSDSFT
jgi:hypothetical protein